MYRSINPDLAGIVSGPKFGTPVLFEVNVTSYVAPAVGEDWNVYTTDMLVTALTTGVPGGSTAGQKGREGDSRVSDIYP